VAFGGRTEPAVSLSDERLAKNEILFREINERLDEMSVPWSKTTDYDESGGCPLRGHDHVGGRRQGHQIFGRHVVRVSTPSAVQGIRAATEPGLLGTTDRAPRSRNISAHSHTAVLRSIGVRGGTSMHRRMSLRGGPLKRSR
jgi:hypothetical protein